MKKVSLVFHPTPPRVLAHVVKHGKPPGFVHALSLIYDTPHYEQQPERSPSTPPITEK